MQYYPERYSYTLLTIMDSVMHRSSRRERSYTARAKRARGPSSGETPTPPSARCAAGSDERCCTVRSCRIAYQKENRSRTRSKQRRSCAGRLELLARVRVVARLRLPPPPHELEGVVEHRQRPHLREKVARRFRQGSTPSVRASAGGHWGRCGRLRICSRTGEMLEIPRRHGVSAGRAPRPPAAAQ